jgi:hypothetical protein
MSSTILGIIASSGAGGGGAAGTYESIATVTVGSGGAASVSFTSISATYTHLQIRYIGRGTVASTQEVMKIEFNSDATAGNYARHWLQGTGSAVNSYGEGNFSDNLRLLAGDTTGSNIFGVGVIDVLDYANTNKYKTTRTLSGYDNNGEGQIALTSGLWKNTAAITTITLTAFSGNLKQYSQFALYGIKGS